MKRFALVLAAVCLVTLFVQSAEAGCGGRLFGGRVRGLVGRVVHRASHPFHSHRGGGCANGQCAVK